MQLLLLIVEAEIGSVDVRRGHFLIPPPRSVGRVAGRRPVGWGSSLANENARALRKRLTPQEVKLWMKLRELKSLGFHFRRQAPIGRYIVDFVSFSSRLIIEADGGQHGMPEGERSDEARDEFLRSQGFKVLRFWNSDIDANLTGVMESILSALRHPPPDRPSAGHPPHKGEG